MQQLALAFYIIYLTHSFHTDPEKSMQKVKSMLQNWNQWNSFVKVKSVKLLLFYIIMIDTLLKTRARREDS